MWIACSPRVFAAACACLNSTSTLTGLFVGLTSTAMLVVVGTSSPQYFNPLRRYLCIQGRDACEISAWPVQAGDQPQADGVASHQEHDRNCHSRSLCGESAEAGASSCDHGHPTA